MFQDTPSPVGYLCRLVCAAEPSLSDESLQLHGTWVECLHCGKVSTHTAWAENTMAIPQKKHHVLGFKQHPNWKMLIMIWRYLWNPYIFQGRLPDSETLWSHKYGFPHAPHDRDDWLNRGVILGVLAKLPKSMHEPKLQERWSNWREMMGEICETKKMLFFFVSGELICLFFWGGEWSFLWCFLLFLLVCFSYFGWCIERLYCSKNILHLLTWIL